MIRPIYLLIIPCLVAFQCNSKKDASNDTGIPVLETGSVTPMPDEWIDKDTGHKISKLSRREGGGRSFYFHNNPFVTQLTDEGDKMVFYGVVDSVSQLFALNLKTLEIKQLTHHPSRIFGEIVSVSRREAFYQSQDSVYAVNIDNGATRLIFVFPEDFKGGVTTVNANGALLAGVHSVEDKRKILEKFPEKRNFFTAIFEARLPHTLFTVNVETGELKQIHSENAWLNHVQFSPTEPEMLMYCHEGPWHLLDRIWTINVKTSEIKKIHERQMDMEIAGHEFWSRDGHTIWYDLQTPKGKEFYLAGFNLKTGEFSKYQMTADEWSIHFNLSPDQQLFAGDGGDSTQVAKAKDGMWIYLFKPEGDKLASKRLVNMKHHDYNLEPNVHFSPDGKWIIFRANFEGESQVYAVEVNGQRAES